MGVVLVVVVPVGVEFLVQLLSPDRQVIDERRTHNLMMTNGFNLFAAALAWSMTQDINGALGNPLTPTAMTPLYGAVGTGTGVPASSDTQLGSELSRAQASAVVVTGATVTWYFEWGLTQANGIISEVGLFGQASGGANTGTLLDHAAIDPALNKTNTTLLVYQATLTVSGT